MEVEAKGQFFDLGCISRRRWVVMFALALARPLTWRLAAEPPSPVVDTGTAHSANSGGLPIVVLLLLGSVLVLGAMVRGLLATMAQMLGQVVKLFGMLLLALLVAVVLLAGMLSHASSNPPPPTPTITSPATTAPSHPVPRAGS
jgi:hypothetical protein